MTAIQNDSPAPSVPNFTTYYFEDLKEGMSASFGKTITEGDIYTFAGVSGDLNPVHVNEEFAKATMFIANMPITATPRTMSSVAIRGARARSDCATRGSP